VGGPVEPITRLAKGSPEYKRDYRLGWAASERGTEGALDRADGRNVSHAWYDGYMDSACGREKWHLMHCPDHDHCPG
jgi:hypothetical protein